MRVIVAGARTVTDRAPVWGSLDEFYTVMPIEVVIHGDCHGPDRFGRDWAEKKGIEEKAYPANWKPEGPRGPTDRGQGSRGTRRWPDRQMP